MKKVFIVLLFALSLTLVGCGNKTTGGGPKDPTTVITTTDGGEQLPEYDDNNNKYVDLSVLTDDGIEYVKFNDCIDDSKYPQFEDVHSSSQQLSNEIDYSKKLGFVHANGKYNFTDTSYLLEGAQIVSDCVGAKIIKIWLTKAMVDQYQFNGTWESDSWTSVADIIDNEDIRTLFKMNLDVYVMVTYEYNRLNMAKETLFTADELNYVRDEFYALTSKLMRTNNGRGKTFVLQNWEGDNELGPTLQDVNERSDLNADQKQALREIVIQNYIDYNNARIDGINRAKEELKDTVSGVEVLGALEVNKLSYSSPVEKLVDAVVPYSKADLFSFSDWSTPNSQLAADLNYYLNKINLYREDSEKKTMNDIYLGEYGRREDNSSEEIQFEYSIETMKIATNAGVRYVVYWATLCNERAGGESARPNNEDMIGYWLIKPDGTFTKTFWYFRGLLNNKNYLANGKPKYVLRIQCTAEEVIPFVLEDIIFEDLYDDYNLSTQEFDISKNKLVWDYSEGMIYDYIKLRDRPFFDRYIEKYNILDDRYDDPKDLAYHVVQKKMGVVSDEYVAYKIVRDEGQEVAKFVLQGFAYDQTVKSAIKVMVSTDDETYVDIKSVYVLDKTGEYGYLYITTLIPKEYEYVRIMFTNKIASNTWDPLIYRAAFLK